jgi:cysteine desulfurase
MIFLDYNSTTPLDRGVKLAMDKLPEFLGNPGSSQHSLGRQSELKFTQARESIAFKLNVSPQEVIFTSGASEAAAISLYGLGLFNGNTSGNKRNRILTTRLEHKAVLETLGNLAELKNIKIQYVPTSLTGEIDLDALAETLSDDVIFGCFMAVNNEIGHQQDLATISEMLHRNGAFLVSDFTQALGKAELQDLHSVDAFFFSGHKIYGPRGVGALVIRRLTQKSMFHLLFGGGQERGFRGGTPDVQAAVGLAAAVELSIDNLHHDILHYKELRKQFLETLQFSGVTFRINGDPETTVPNTINFQLPGVDGEELIANCPELAISTGSACNSANPEPSHVLLGLGLSFKAASESVRVSLGRQNTLNEVTDAAQIIAAYVVPAQNEDAGGSK